MFKKLKKFRPFQWARSVDYILRHKILSGKLPFNTKLPKIKEMADNQLFSDRAVKEGYQRLLSAGLLKTAKRGGTSVNFKGDSKVVSNYNKNYVHFQNLIQLMFQQGFELDDIVACFYNAILDIEEKNFPIILVEVNVFDLLQGKEELSTILSCNIQGMLYEIFKIRYQDFFNKIIVTSFKNYLKIKSLSNKLTIIPLKTTPPLEEFINFDEVESNAKILYLTTSEENKKHLEESYNYLKKSFKNFEIILYEEYNEDITPDIIIGTKDILNLIKIPEKTRQVVLNRFYDKEGINYILEKLNNMES